MDGDFVIAGGGNSDFVYARLQTGSDDIETAYSKTDIARKVVTLK